MELSILLLVLTFFVALLSSIFSGIAGGGGGFIMAPWQLLIGFSPVQMVATGSIGGSSMAAGSLLAMRRSGVRWEKFPTFVFGIVAIISSLLASAVLPSIDTDLFNTCIAIITILSLPLFFINHIRFKHGDRSSQSRLVGYVVVCILLILGAVLFSSAFSLLTALVLPYFFGTSTHETTTVRRIVGLLQMIVLAITLYQYIVWIYLLASVTGGFIGSYIGTHIAVRNSEKFARNAIAIGATISVVALLW